jgi:outer membrane protein OmpA-like peptidoglycan-associated protein
MNTRKLFLAAASVGLIGLLGACTPTVPKELADARAAYTRASTGVAARAAPAELHVASDALALAEQAFEKEPKSFQTRDLAYIAERKAQLAEAAAEIALQRKKKASAQRMFQSTQSGIVDQTKRRLSKTNSRLAASERDRIAAADQAARELQARKAAEQRASDAQAALAKLAAVKNERRGVVITLSGSVLFASGKFTLLPAARSQLGKVADVMLKNRERHLTIEGHTDSRGSDSYNQALSQQRADAVRAFFVERGYHAKLITAIGRGEARPIADNATAEGRANNRRVEIIIDPVQTSSR